MNDFSHMVMQLTKPTITAQVDKKDYYIFCKEFIFDQLVGRTFGSAFCKRFNIKDDIVCLYRSVENAKFYIENCGYIK